MSAPTALRHVGNDGGAYVDHVFLEDNLHISNEWMRIGEIYPEGKKEPLLPNVLSLDDFGQGIHYECFMISTLAALHRTPEVIRNCFVTKEVQVNGRYVFQFFRNKEWVEVVIDDLIAMEEGQVLYIRSPTEKWWPLLLEKAYAKFYTAYDHLEGCTLQEAFHDLTGNPVLNIPTSLKLAKAAGVPVSTGPYWLDLAQRLNNGTVVASGLTKAMDLIQIGLEKQQQYGIRDIFSLTGTSAVKDIVVHLHNQFEEEEYQYKGPLNPQDAAWTPVRRKKHNVDDPRSIFIPLNVFLKVVSTVQVCVMLPRGSEVLYFDDEWNQESAGGNPTRCSWRKNPKYLVRNTSHKEVSYLVSIQQKDQRRYAPADQPTQYLSCGIVLTQYTYPSPLPTEFVTGNNHTHVFRSLFCDVRETASFVTIPAASLCYLIPCCIEAGKESPFTLAWYPMPEMDTSGISIQRLFLPQYNWDSPSRSMMGLCQKEKGRVDFFVDFPCVAHILLRQLNPFTGKNGGDLMARDYMGIHLYDDTDRRIAGVHAATNFREMSIIHQLPRSGRYAISVTCLRAVDVAKVEVLVVTETGSKGRIVLAPEDAPELDLLDDEVIMEAGATSPSKKLTISDTPFVFAKTSVQEEQENVTPYEDRVFFTQNRVTSSPWVHLPDLYPEGVLAPLLPDKLSTSHFTPGKRGECSVLSAIAALLNREEVIRHCFVSKHVRHDCAYTFQFYRFGEWVKVEIDDRIPVEDGEPVFCASPTHHWWPLLLEKAYAKFYTLYENLEGLLFPEMVHDFAGLPVFSISTDYEGALEQGVNLERIGAWEQIQERLHTSNAFAVTPKAEEKCPSGFLDDRSYPVVNIRIESGPYTGTTSTTKGQDSKDEDWSSRRTGERVKILLYDVEKHEVKEITLETLLSGFSLIHEALIQGLVYPASNFFNEWGEGTNGGYPSLVTWRQNPIYLVNNPSSSPILLVASLQLRDQRHLLHRQTNQNLNYVENQLVLAETKTEERIPTFLVTRNNHVLHYHDILMSARETVTKLVIPPRSLCYLVPSALYREKFLLSLWFTSPEDRDCLVVSRLQQGNLNKKAPAIKHMIMSRKEVGRVDINVDIATDLHILLLQKRVFKNADGGDVIAEDFFTMELYNDKDQRVAKTGELVNYREIGLVYHAPSPGRYALVIACMPLVSETVPFEIRVVGFEAANVRITDPPPNAPELGIADLFFLEEMPDMDQEGKAPLATDKDFQDALNQMKHYSHYGDRYEKEMKALEERMKDRARHLAKERNTSPTKDGEKNEVMGLEAAEELSVMEGQETDGEVGEKSECSGTLTSKKRNAEDNTEEKQSKEDVDKNQSTNTCPPPPTRETATVEPTTTSGLMEGQRKAGVSTSSPFSSSSSRGTSPRMPSGSRGDLPSILSTAYEGIPTEQLHLLEDPKFDALRQERLALLTDRSQHAREIYSLGEALQERARSVSKQVHAEERSFLPSSVEGIPLDLLPLDEDEIFTAKEAERRALSQEKSVNTEKNTALQQQLHERAVELARQLKQSERDLFLDPQPLGIPVSELSLDTDSIFHPLEVERLYKRKENPEQLGAIQELEKKLTDRVTAMAQECISGLRTYLDPFPYGIPLEYLDLDNDEQCRALEKELLAFRNADSPKRTEEEKIQEDIKRLVERKAALLAKQDRVFLDPDPEGRRIAGVPLLENETFLALDKERRTLLYQQRELERQKKLEKEMNDLAHQMAHQLNVEDRPRYLEETYKGVPLSELSLDEDETFKTLEIDRAILLQDATRNDRVIAETEGALVSRVMELADAYMSRDRGYLHPTPDDIPLRFLSLGTDAIFGELEEKRMQIKQGTRTLLLTGAAAGNTLAQQREQVAAVEEELNARAVALAKELRSIQRKNFMEPKYLCVSFSYLPLPTDTLFRSLEVERLLEMEKRENVEEIISQLHARAVVLAKEFLREERKSYLDLAPLGIPVGELPLNDEEVYLRLEEGRRELLEKLLKLREQNGDTRKKMEEEKHKVEEQLLEMANDFARAKYYEQRHQILDPLPLEHHILDTDAPFLQWEREYYALQHSAGRVREEDTPHLKELQQEMNVRNVVLCKELMKRERASYLAPTFCDIPYSQLPLDTDAVFENLEWKRARKIRESTDEVDSEHETEKTAEKNSTSKEEKINEEVQELNAKLNERANELAAHQASQDRDFLPLLAEGVPTEYLPLSTDPDFQELEKERLECLSKGKKPEVAKVEEKLISRANELAMERLQVELGFLNPTAFDVPVELLDVLQDKLFMNFLLPLLKDREEGASVEAIRDGVQACNARAVELAKRLLHEDRSAYLYPEEGEKREGVLYYGIPLNDVLFDKDEAFHRLEVEQLLSKKRSESTPESRSKFTEALHNRAMELCEAEVEKDYSFLEPTPLGVPIDVLHPHMDERFFELMNTHRALRRQNNGDRSSRRNTAAIDDLGRKKSSLAGLGGLSTPLQQTQEELNVLEEKLNARLREMVEARMKRERGYLKESYEGVKTAYLPLDKEERFRSLETERALKLSSSSAEEVEALEHSLHAIASEQAIALLKAQLQDVEPNPRGVPLEVLQPMKDDAFRGLLLDRVELHGRQQTKEAPSVEEKEGPSSGANSKRDSTTMAAPTEGKEAEDAVLTQKLNERAREMADAAIHCHREFIGALVNDIPVEDLPLDDDEVFHGLEVQRLMLLEPEEKKKEEDEELQVKRAKEIHELEEALQRRAVELAKERFEEDFANCNRKPLGIPIHLLHPMRDEAVKMLVRYRREAVKTEDEGGVRRADAELNERLITLAKVPLQYIDIEFFPPEMDDVPLKLLPLEDDPIFQDLYLQRIIMMLEDKDGNAPHIALLEESMEVRLTEMAKERKQQELENFSPVYGGYDVHELKPLEDEEFQRRAYDLRACEVEKNDESAMEESRQALEQRLEKIHQALEQRLEEMAKEKADGPLWFIDRAPENIPREYLLLHEDTTFQGLTEQRQEKKLAGASATEIKEVENAMNERAKEIAAGIVAKDFDGVEVQPHGIPLHLLQPSNDPVVQQLLERRHMPDIQQKSNESEEQEIIAALNARVGEMAFDAVRGDRPEYLAEEIGGVPREDVEWRLNEDPIFNGLEEELAVLKLSAPASSSIAPSSTEELKARLRERAEELAKKTLEEDLRPLTREVESVPITALNPQEDKDFAALATKARSLRRALQEEEATLETQEALRKALKEKEQEMNARVAGIFKERLHANRDYLDPFPEGVPLEFLPLDTDTEFHTLEKHHWNLTMLRGEELPPGTEAEILLLEQHLNCRAHELALIRLEEDFDGLQSSPRGVPLEVLRPHSSFSSVVPQLRQLKVPSEMGRNQQKRLQEIQKEMDHILDGMAAEFLAKDRALYLDSTPDGVPLSLLSLDEDETFKELERQRFAQMRVSLVHPVVPSGLLASSVSSNVSTTSTPEEAGVARSGLSLQQQVAIRNLEDDLNARAVVLAKAYRERSRAAFLPPSYNGVPLAGLRLSDDQQFVEMESKRFAHKAKDPERNAVAIRLLEERMRERAKKLAENFSGNELEGVKECEGIPLSLLCPFQDDVFHEYVLTRRALPSASRSSSEKGGETATTTSPAEGAEEAAIVEKMNERVVELTHQAITGRRAEYLAERPEGIPFLVLPLDEDEVFHKLEVQRTIAALSFAPKAEVEKLEEQLNQRAKELAKEQVKIDLEDLRPTVFGVPTASLAPHLDRSFAELADERRPLSKDSPSYERLTSEMNEHMEILFSEKQAANRSSYIPRRVCGVPQQCIPFAGDARFRELEGAWMVANQRGEGVPAATKAVVARAEELAREVLRKDRVSYLGVKLEDIPISQLALDADATFTNLEVQRANVYYLDEPLRSGEEEQTEGSGVAKDGSSSLSVRVTTRDEVKVKELEIALLQRAKEIAKQQQEKDLELLERAPRSIPVSSLFPHRDTAFSAMLPEWRMARQDPVAHSAQLITMKVNLNKRLDELAKAYIDVERAFLSRHPQGVPLALVPLDSDSPFLAMEAELRQLRQAPLSSLPDGGVGRQKEIKVLQTQMQERCDELAKAILERDRSYLHPNTAGVPLTEVPLDSDTEFLKLERERLQLVQDHPEDKDAITALEEKLSARATVLAEEMKMAERAFLRPTSANIPIELLPLDEDTTFTNLMQQLRRLKHRDSARGGDAVVELQDLLQRRADAIGEQVLKRDRPVFIHTSSLAPFSIEDLPLDDSTAFTSGELERILLVLRDPVQKASEIKVWSEKLNVIAQSLCSALRHKDRDFLDPNPEGIPLADLSLDTDPQIIRLEGYLRLLLKEKPPKEAVVAETKGRILARVQELTLKVKEEDIQALPEDAYHGIVKEDLGLHSFPDFREEANLYRACAREVQGNPDAVTAACEHLNEMSRLAGLHATELLREERRFLDPEPEGMLLEDVPLDENPDFLVAETERRRRLKDALSQVRNARLITELEEKMNALAHACAMEAFRKRRAEVIPPFPEGISLAKLPLDTDTIFREAEIAYYRVERDPYSSKGEKEAALGRMLLRVRELAMTFAQQDTTFLNPEPSGVPLEKLHLQDDVVFAALAKERAEAIVAQQPKSVSMNDSRQSSGKGSPLEQNWGSPSGIVASSASPSPFPPSPSPSSTSSDFGSSRIQEIEASMQERSCDLAKAFLKQRRDYLNPAPQNVPLADLPLLEDPIFHEKECKELLLALEDPEKNKELVARLQTELNERADELAWELLRAERAHQDQQPSGVPLWDLPLNNDSELIALERERRALKKKQQQSASQSKGEEKTKEELDGMEVLKEVQKKIAARVEEIALAFLWEERRSYLDSTPEGLPLESLPLGEDMVFAQMEKARREAVQNGQDDKKASLEAALQQRTQELARQHLLNEEKEKEEEETAKDSSPHHKKEGSDAPEDGSAVATENEAEEAMKSTSTVHSAVTDLKEAEEEEEPPQEEEEGAKEDSPANASSPSNAVSSQPSLQNDKDREGSKIELVSFQSTQSTRKVTEPPAAKEQKKEGSAGASRVETSKRTPEALSPISTKEERPPSPEAERARKHSSPKGGSNEKEKPDSSHPTPSSRPNQAGTTSNTSSVTRDRGYLPLHPRGVALEYLPLDEDDQFLELEAQREALLKKKPRGDVKEVEKRLCERVDQLAEEYLKAERDEYIEPEPEGVARESLELDDDPEFVSLSIDRRALKKALYPDEEAIKGLEEKLLARVSELAKLKRGWQDTEFFDTNASIADEWPRLRELFPEGLYEPLTPDTTWPVDTLGTNGKYGFLAPFIAAMAKHTGLIDRMFPDRAHPQFNPYVVTLFELDGSPAKIEVDDRIPCDAQKVPLFTAAPTSLRPRMWYPFLIEKAYAKFVYGYKNFTEFAPGCPADIFHILTGRPVVAHSLSASLSYHGKFGLASNTLGYWRRIKHFLLRGDVLVAQTTEGEKKDGLAPMACYPILNVVDFYPNNDDEEEEGDEEEDAHGIGICLYDCYVDPATRYHGPVLPLTPDELGKAGLPRLQDGSGYEDHGNIVMIPLSTFLRSFSTLYRAVINCGGRYSTHGEWGEDSCGGNPLLQTFRKNPAYLVENKCGLPAPLVVEVQHEISDTGCYPLTGVALLQSIAPSRLPPTTLFTYTTHKLLYDSGTMNLPQVFISVDIPPHTTCYMVPYLSTPSLRGKFRLSIYPDIYPVTLTPLLDAGLTGAPLVQSLDLSPATKEAGTVGFHVPEPCDIHLLVSQVKRSGSNASARRASVSTMNNSGSSMVAGDAVSVCVLNEYGIKMASSGGAHLLREISLIFPAPKAGNYIVLAHCNNSSTGGTCSVQVSIYTPQRVTASLVPVKEVLEMQQVGLAQLLPNSPRFAPQRPFISAPSGRPRGRPHQYHRSRPRSGSLTRGRR